MQKAPTSIKQDQMKRSIIMNKNHIVLIFPVTTFIAFISCSMPFYSHIVHCCCYLMIQVFLYIIISITAYARVPCLWNADLFFFCVSLPISLPVSIPCIVNINRFTPVSMTFRFFLSFSVRYGFQCYSKLFSNSF